MFFKKWHATVKPGSRLDRWWLPASCGIALQSVASNDHATLTKKIRSTPVTRWPLLSSAFWSRIELTGWISVQSSTQPKESKRLKSEKITKHENHSCDCITLDHLFPRTGTRCFWVDSFFAFDISHCVCCVTWHLRLKQHGASIFFGILPVLAYIYICYMYIYIYICIFAYYYIIDILVSFTFWKGQYIAIAALGARANIFHLIALTVHGGKIWRIKSIWQKLLGWNQFELANCVHEKLIRTRNPFSTPFFKDFLVPGPGGAKTKFRSVALSLFAGQSPLERNTSSPWSGNACVSVFLEDFKGEYLTVSQSHKQTVSNTIERWITCHWNSIFIFHSAPNISLVTPPGGKVSLGLANVCYAAHILKLS